MIKTDIDWAVHKKVIYDKILFGAGQKRADIFMNHYSQRYDHIKRNVIDWKLAYSLLFDDYAYCKNVGTRWFAFVGTGGTGKSTLLKNVFYWLDNKFQPDDLVLDVDSFIKKLYEKDRFNMMRGLAMDEPDDDIHPQTQLGKTLRSVLGKARQGRYFFGVCATDLTDIPPYIYRKIDVVIFTPYKGAGMIFKNEPKKRSYLVQRIRKDYQEKGYKVFYELQNEEGCILFNTKRGTPWTDEQEKDYIKTKQEDFYDEIDKAFAFVNEKNKPLVKKVGDDYKKSVISRFEQGYSQREIARQDKKSDTKKIRAIIKEYQASSDKNLISDIKSPLKKLNLSGAGVVKRPLINSLRMKKGVSVGLKAELDGDL